MVDVLFGTLISVSGAFTLLTIIWTAVMVFGHAAHFNKPEQQKYIIRILLMAPIYAVDSWLSLLLRRESQWATFFDISRDCYEAYAIFSFFKLLVSYMGGQEAVQSLTSHKAPQNYAFPFSFVRLNGRQFYYRCLQGILQYVIIRPLMAVTAAALNFYGLYGEGQFTANVGYPYIAAINSVSVMIALYYLVEFYQLFQLELKPHAPLPKFLVIKGVIFFTFWQSVAITIGGWIGVISGTPQYSAQTVEFFLNDSLVCLEMFLAAVVHTYAFSYKVYAVRSQDEYLVSETKNSVRMGITRVRQNIGSTLWQVGNQKDIVDDTTRAVRGDQQKEAKYHKMVDDEDVHTTTEEELSTSTTIEIITPIATPTVASTAEIMAARPSVIAPLPISLSSPGLWAANMDSDDEAEGDSHEVNSQGQFKNTALAKKQIPQISLENAQNGAILFAGKPDSAFSPVALH